MWGKRTELNHIKKLWFALNFEVKFMLKSAFKIQWGWCKWMSSLLMQMKSSLYRGWADAWVQAWVSLWFFFFCFCWDHRQKLLDLKAGSLFSFYFSLKISSWVNVGNVNRFSCVEVSSTALHSLVLSGSFCSSVTLPPAWVGAEHREGMGVGGQALYSLIDQ